MTVIATGFSAEKASMFNVRRPISPELAGMAAGKKTLAQEVFASFEPSKSPVPEDAMMIPAYLRRKKNRS